MNLPNIPDTATWIPLSEFQKLVPSISPRTLRRWCAQAEIPASRRGGGRWYIDVVALREAADQLSRAKQSQDAVDSGIWMFADDTWVEPPPDSDDVDRF